MSKFYRKSFAAFILMIAAFLAPSGTAHAQNNNGSGTSNYAGYVDRVGCDIIGGWAADRNRLNNSIAVNIYSDGVWVTTIPASASRPDVGSFLGDNGLHGFTVTTPASLTDGQIHQVQVVFESSTVNLTNSPTAMVCNPKQPPPLCADHEITTTPNQGASSVVMNHFCRDTDLRTRYDAGRYVTINNPVLQETILLDTYTRTFGIFSVQSSGRLTDYSAAVSTDMTTPGPKPPARPPAGCPTGNDGWSVHTPSAPNNMPPLVPSSAPVQTLNVWPCPSYVLPMYIEKIDPSFGKLELEFKNIRLGTPDESFDPPADYTRDDSLSSSVAFGSSCVVSETVEPIIVVSTSSHPGQTVATAVTDSGCQFTDAKIYTGRSLGAIPLTSRGSSVFQLSVWDTSNPSYTNPVDTAQVSLSTIDGSVSSHSVILLKF